MRAIDRLAAVAAMGACHFLDRMFEVAESIRAFEHGHGIASPRRRNP